MALSIINIIAWLHSGFGVLQVNVKKYLVLGPNKKK